MKKIILTLALLLVSLTAGAYDWYIGAPFTSPTLGAAPTIIGLQADGSPCIVTYYVLEDRARGACAALSGVTMIDGVLTVSSTPGATGRSAFQLAQDAGYPDTVTAWLVSLKGVAGNTGSQGIQGVQGIQGNAGSPAANDWLSMTSKPTTVAALGVSDAVSTTSLASTLTTYATVAAVSFKYTTPACPTSQYLRGDGSCMTFPAQVAADWNASSGVSKILNQPLMQRTRVQTASDGTYTWTFPTAYGAGVTPIIELMAEGDATTNYQQVITAISNTSVSVKLTKLQDVTVLTIHVMGIQAAGATFIHLTAISP